MEPEIIRVIAPLPPKGNVAARHAGRVIYHLDEAGFDVRPATTIQPAFNLDLLRFAPKAAYLADKAALLAPLDRLVLYPEGLDFSQISQKRLWHHWLERYRRLGLVWHLLGRAKHSLVVFRPRQLKRVDHLAMVILACIAKLRHPKRVRLCRQKNAPEMVVVPMLGHQPRAATPEGAEQTSLNLAVKHGAKAGLRLTPVWLNAAFYRMAKTDPLYEEIKTLRKVVEHFGESGLPVLARPCGPITTLPFEDPPAPLHGVALTRFMRHLHHAKRLWPHYPLETPAQVRRFQDWYHNEAPHICHHALPRATPEQISAALTPKSLAAALHRIVANARFFGAEKGVDPALAAWLNTTLPGGASRLQLLLAVLGHAPVTQVQALQTPWQAPELAPWFKARAFAGYPALAGLARLTLPHPAPRLLTTGDLAADTGLGQNQRMSKAALHGLAAKRPLCLHHVNADAIPAQMLSQHSPGTTHIGFLLWELEALPEAHKLAGNLLDEAWVPTRFVQQIYQRAYDIPVIRMGKGFDLPPPVPFDLARLGVRPDQPVFLLSFDLHSSVARKNPLAAVHAFQMAFEGNPEARLVIKTSLPVKNHWGDPERQMEIILKLMKRDKRIILLQEHLPFAAYLGLIQAATALVSPHRAEGFGYVPAYAMALGTPVIATDYAGTQDFCNAGTALPVPWRKRQVRAGEAIFPLENAHWAEIDHEALARAMQEVLAKPDAAATRAAAGKALMLREYSMAALSRRYRARLAEIGVISP